MAHPQPLSFEEFIARDLLLQGHPRYDNFPMYFNPKGMAPYLRETPQFLDFQLREPDLEASLTLQISSTDKSIDKAEALKPYESGLYKAYMVMFEYLCGHKSADPNQDLLIGPKQSRKPIL